MSVKYMTWAWSQAIPISTKGVLLALADHADDDGLCWPGIKGLSKKCQIIDRNVQRHIAKLVKLGLISAEPRKRDDGSQMSNSYRLHLDVSVDNIDRGGMSKLTGEGGGDVTGGVAEASPLEPSVEPSLNPSPNPLLPIWINNLLENDVGAKELDDRTINQMIRWSKGKSETILEDKSLELATQWPAVKDSKHKTYKGTFYGWVTWTIRNKNGRFPNGKSRTDTAKDQTELRPGYERPRKKGHY